MRHVYISLRSLSQGIRTFFLRDIEHGDIRPQRNKVQHSHVSQAAETCHAYFVASLSDILGIDQDWREIKASDYRGRKIVLYSYPKANTSGCTAEACSLQAHKAELAAAGYDIIGVSKDSQALQKKIADAKGLEFPLIADTDTTLLQTLGCWGEKVFCGRKSIGILRTTYLVNEEGIIEKIFTPKEIKTKVHAEQILDYIESK